MKDTDFILWLVGFTEGGASWFVRKNNTVGFEISQHTVDAALLYKIKKFLTFGSVNHNSRLKLSHYCLTGKNQIKIIELFNNQLHLNKRFSQFRSWSSFVFTNLENTPENINFIRKNKNSVTLNDAWLSGFLDAECCFSITVDKHSNSCPKLIFEISQTEREILEEIGAALSLKRNIRKDRGTYVLSTSSFHARARIIEYLNKFPLKTKKSISFKHWCKAHVLSATPCKHNWDKILKFKQRIFANVKNANNLTEVSSDS